MVNLFFNDGVIFFLFFLINISSVIVLYIGGGNLLFEVFINKILGFFLEVVLKDVIGVEVLIMFEVMNMFGVLLIKVLFNELLFVKRVLVVEVLFDIWMLFIELFVERVRFVELFVDGVLFIELFVERVRLVKLFVDRVLFFSVLFVVWVLFVELLFVVLLIEFLLVVDVFKVVRMLFVFVVRFVVKLLRVVEVL